MKSLLKYHILFILIFALKSVNAQEYNFELVNHFQAGAGFYGTPLVTDDLIVIGSHDKYIYFFDHRGKIVNYYKTGGFVHATAEELNDGKIAIGSYDRNMYVFSKNGDLLDIYNIGGRIFTNVKQSIDDLMVFGCNNSLVFVNPDTKEVLKHKTENLIHGSIEIFSNGQLAVGANNNKLYLINSIDDIIEDYSADGWILHSKPLELSSGEIVFGSYDKRLHFLSPDGKPAGKVKLGGRIHSNPVETKDNKILVAAMNGSLYYISLSGKLLHEFKTNKRIVSTPAVLPNGNIVVGSYDKNIYLLDNSANQLAKFNVDGKVFSSLALINDDSIAVATTNGHFYIFKISSKTDQECYYGSK